MALDVAAIQRELEGLRRERYSVSVKAAVGSMCRGCWMGPGDAMSRQ